MGLAERACTTTREGDFFGRENIVLRGEQRRKTPFFCRKLKSKKKRTKRTEEDFRGEKNERGEENTEREIYVKYGVRNTEKRKNFGVKSLPRSQYFLSGPLPLSLKPSPCFSFSFSANQKPPPLTTYITPQHLHSLCHTSQQLSHLLC